MSDNILQTLIDCLFDTAVLTTKVFWNFTKWCFDGWINFDDKKDLKYFYETVGTKNKLNEYPTEVKIKSDDKYVLKIPTGMNMDDFEKTRKSLEAYLNYDVAMTLDNGYLTITKADNKKLAENISYKLNKRTVSHIKFTIGESIK